MEPITYEDFSKIRVVLGTIRSVEIVEGADKLLKLSVDVGEPEPRQILSAIRLYVADPQTLVGTTCPFLVNIAPRTIRGFESHGMIIAAEHEGTLAFLQPSVPLPPGTKVL